MNNLLTLPSRTAKDVSKKIKILERDPISANGDAKKLSISNHKIYRVRIGDYRLIYGIGKKTIKLCGIGHRSKIYKNLKIDTNDLPSDDVNFEDIPEIPEVKIQQQQEHNSSYQSTINSSDLGISEDLLKQTRVPSEYWETLLTIQNEEELLNSQVPNSILSKLLDRLYPQSINEILEQPEYVLEDIEYLDRYFEGDAFEPFLRLDIEQQRLLDLEIDEPILVRGGPGTGKSVMAIYHIKRLVDEGPSYILLATHSSSFSAYAKQLLERLLGQSVDETRVEIRTVESLLQQYFCQYIENPRTPNKETQISFLEKAIDYCHSNMPDGFRRLHWSISHDKVLKLGYEYILEEIQDVIESCCLTKEEYMILDRRGRGTSVGLKERSFLWEVTQKWHSLLTDNNYFSRGSISKKVLELVSQSTSKKYDYLVIDEAQDISPINFKFLLELVSKRTNIYVTADEAQAIYRRGFSWRLIYQILNSKKVLSLNCNFRNTEQISAACSIILENSNDNPARSYGELPTIVEVNDFNQEVSIIKNFLIESAKKNRISLSTAAVLCPSDYLAQKYASHISDMSLAAKYVRGGDIDIDKPFIKVLNLFDAKGLEFPIVAIAGISSDTFPGNLDQIPSDEKDMVISQYKRMLYVGCSRAMKALLVTKSAENPSELTDSMREPLWRQWRID